MPPRTCAAAGRTAAAGCVAVELDAQGEARYVLGKDEAWEEIRAEGGGTALPDVDVDLLYLGTTASTPVNQATVRSLVGHYRPRHVLLDVNLRPGGDRSAAIDFGIGLATCLKCNEDEIHVVCDRFQAAGPAGLLAAFPNLQHIAVTLGPGGAEVHSREAHKRGHVVCHVAAEAVGQGEVVDTVGAGDAFAATMAAGLMVSACVSTRKRVRMQQAETRGRGREGQGGTGRLCLSSVCPSISSSPPVVFVSFPARTRMVFPP